MLPEINVNAQDEYGNTALHYAVSNRVGDPSLVGLLLQHGANPNAQNVRRQTPISINIETCRVDAPLLLFLLLEFGADPNVTLLNDETALHLAVERCFVKMARALVSAGANMNLKRKSDMQSVFDLIKSFPVFEAQMFQAIRSASQKIKYFKGSCCMECQRPISETTACNCTICGRLCCRDCSSKKVATRNLPISFSKHRKVTIMKPTFGFLRSHVKACTKCEKIKTLTD